METSSCVASVTVFVDPSCPFAWITSRWLDEVAGHNGLAVRRELMSISALNEGRELDDWYRAYNDHAWRPARVAAALLASKDGEAWPAFYATFGHRRHVDEVRDNPVNLRLTLDQMGLPADLADAAEDPAWDEDLRRRTTYACEPLGGDGGTPVLHVGARAYFGPVLTEIPRGEAAVRLWQAIEALATTPGFSEIKGPRADDLHTA